MEYINWRGVRLSYLVFTLHLHATLNVPRLRSRGYFYASFILQNSNQLESIPLCIQNTYCINLNRWAKVNEDLARPTASCGMDRALWREECGFTKQPRYLERDDPTADGTELRSHNSPDRPGIASNSISAMQYQLFPVDLSIAHLGIRPQH